MSSGPKRYTGDLQSGGCPGLDRIYAAAAEHSSMANVFVRILFTTGLRIAAIARLTWSQFDGDPSVISVREKGQHIRNALINRDVHAAVLRLRLDKRRARVVSYVR
jgi:integrase